STPPQGGRQRRGSSTSPSKSFQSTPPQGGRPKSCRGGSASRRFNPRPRRGGDDHAARFLVLLAVSIHAPAGGATVERFQLANLRWFQSTPPQGGRHQE